MKMCMHLVSFACCIFSLSRNLLFITENKNIRTQIHLTTKNKCDDI